MSGDQEILSDFIAPPNVTNITGTFTFTSIRALVGAPIPTTFKVSKASIAELPALSGQRISCDVLQFPLGTVNPPHTHPHSAVLV
ncbi:hypothetical protein ACSBR2_033232 [Camellia fascicularis]